MQVTQTYSSSLFVVLRVRSSLACFSTFLSLFIFSLVFRFFLVPFSLCLCLSSSLSLSFFTSPLPLPSLFSHTRGLFGLLPHSPISPHLTACSCCTHLATHSACLLPLLAVVSSRACLLHHAPPLHTLLCSACDGGGEH